MTPPQKISFLLCFFAFIEEKRSVASVVNGEKGFVVHQKKMELVADYLGVRKGDKNMGLFLGKRGVLYCCTL